MNDIKPGLDISALSSLSKTQLIQMITGITPVGDGSQEGIGFVIVQAGVAATKTNFPDVGTYPRFARYPWIDTEISSSPVIKVYAGGYDGNNAPASNTYDDWVVATIGDASISTSKIQDGAVTLEKLSATDSLNGNKLLFTSSDGLTISAVSLNDLLKLPSTDLPLASLSLQGGTAGYLLGVNSSGSSYSFYNPSTLLADSVVAGSFPLAKLVYGSGGTAQHLISRTTVPATGEAMWANYDPANTINTGSSKLLPSALDTTTVPASSVIQFNGSIWEYAVLSGATITTASDVTALTSGGTTELVSIGAAAPKMFGIDIEVVASAYGELPVGSKIDFNKVAGLVQSGATANYLSYIVMTSVPIGFGPPSLYVKKEGATYKLKLNAIHAITTAAMLDTLGYLRLGTTQIGLTLNNTLPTGTIDGGAVTWIQVKLIPWYIL